MRRTVTSAFWGMPVVLLFLLALVAGRDRAAPRGDRAATAGDRVERYTVEITVDTETGEFSYSLDPVHATRGDQIRWTSAQGNWSVHFIDNTPFAQKLLRGKRAGPKQLPIRGNAENGNYKYFVAVAIEDDVFTDDPVIIVGPN